MADTAGSASAATKKSYPTHNAELSKLSELVRPVAHTPGPWKASGNGIHKGTTCVALAHMVPFEQRAADARLIAAAPELLEVLQLIQRGYGVTFQDAALRGLIAAAIAKATGSAA